MSQYSIRDRIMRFVSPILKRVVYPCLADAGYLRWRSEGGSLCVVNYHGILPLGYTVSDPLQDGALITAENFRRQLRLLKSHYHVVSPTDVLNWAVNDAELPERAVLLTCDDGLVNAVTEVAPILREEDLTCLFLVLGASAEERPRTLWYEELYSLLLAAPSGTFSFDSLGVRLDLGDRSKRRFLWWSLVEQLSQCSPLSRAGFIEKVRAEFGLSEKWNHDCESEALRRRFSLLTSADLRQLVNQGMTIGSHTLTHPMLSRQNDALAWNEVFESRKALQKATGQTVWALAYPFGDPPSVSERDVQMAEQAGYACAFMNVGGGFGARLPRFAIPRIHVTGDMNLSEFEAHISGFHRDFRARLTGERLDAVMVESHA
jgi:peptidoglycan/xylan/chitin deacetylase (PgdA/CDA1 family)